jgi:polygalacturonase
VAKITEYGAVGDGKTLNTAAFAKAVADLSERARDGGAALVVPPGKWLTGPFNLTSHFTLYLDEGAEILASQVRIHPSLAAISSASLLLPRLRRALAEKPPL